MLQIQAWFISQTMKNAPQLSVSCKKTYPGRGKGAKLQTKRKKSPSDQDSLHYNNQHNTSLQKIVQYTQTPRQS
jgi:hypothetical protein